MQLVHGHFSSLKKHRAERRMILHAHHGFHSMYWVNAHESNCIFEYVSDKTRVQYNCQAFFPSCIIIIIIIIIILVAVAVAVAVVVVVTIIRIRIILKSTTTIIVIITITNNQNFPPSSNNHPSQSATSPCVEKDNHQLFTNIFEILAESLRGCDIANSYKVAAHVTVVPQHGKQPTNVKKDPSMWSIWGTFAKRYDSDIEELGAQLMHTSAGYIYISFMTVYFYPMFGHLARRSVRS